MKKIIIIMLIILGLMTTLAFADSTNLPNLGVDEIILSEEREEEFNKNVADITTDKHMVIQSYQKKQGENKNVMALDEDDIKASESIQIHAFASMSYSEFYNSYEETNSFDSFIDSDNAIISVYRDKYLNYISSILFIKSKINDTSEEWQSTSEGEFILSTETIQFLSNKDSIKNSFKELGIKNPKHVRVVVGIPGIDGAIYLKEDDKEIIIPLSDGIKYEGEDIEVCKAFTAYLAIDFFDARKASALENEKNYKDMYEKAGGQIIYGAEPSINYINLKPVELLSVTTSLVSDNSNKSQININYLLVGAASIGIVGVIIIYCKKRRIYS